MFKLEMLEFKNTLVGDDADSLLFGDFDLTFEILATRLEARGGRTFEGFERTRGVRTAKCIEEYNRSCLSRLGRFNLFKRI